jgi:cell division protease FtsH
MAEDFIKRIEERKAKLEYAKKELKKKFIGINEVIDKVIDNISLWYITPEIQFKPLIVSLWGITGVGKTDLVRTLVKLLDFTDKFIEIQMDIESEYGTANVEDYLKNSDVDTHEPGVLLLDEVQRYRTIDEHGKMIKNRHFNDVWMLLSDGKFQNNSQRKREIMEMLLDEMYWEDQRKNAPEDDSLEGKDIKLDVPNIENTGSSVPNSGKKKKPKKLKYQTSLWTANRFKRMLNLTINAEDIMKMTLSQRIELMEESLKSKNINEGKSYEKLLIFVSGNLDEAFRMADDVEDSESDADIMHELSKRVNVVQIKHALSKKFKPEQIARFGNNHVIYPCLDKKAYQTIIHMNCQEILDRIQKEHGIRIELSDAIYDIIYRNGVFPAQGVRPAISTVFNLLGSNLPHFIYHALIPDLKYFKLDYSKDKIFAEINHKKVSKKVILELDEIRKNKSVDEKMLIVVHEIGHALVYALLFNTPPKQINTNSSGLSGGFNINHHSVDNKTFIKDKLAIYMAGLAAEELVFGEEFKSAGSEMDILYATHAAANYVRSYGMDSTISTIMRPEVQTQYQGNYDTDTTNPIIESLIMDEKKRARDILNDNVGIYKILVKHAIELGKMPIPDFLKLCNENGMKLEQKEINEKLIYSYDEKVKQFLK